jgi:hypothetical protein
MNKGCSPAVVLGKCARPREREDDTQTSVNQNLCLFAAMHTPCLSPQDARRDSGARLTPGVRRLTLETAACERGMF